MARNDSAVSMPILVLAINNGPCTGPCALKRKNKRKPINPWSNFTTTPPPGPAAA